MTPPTASEIEFIDSLLAELARKRHAFVKFGQPIEPLHVGSRRAREIEASIAAGHLYPEGDCWLGPAGERWIASIDGVHVIEVSE
jgi:hypothetical protein